MGTYFTKDEEIDLYLSVDQEYYYPGDIVSGVAYLHAKSTRKYQNMQIAVAGQEYLRWQEGSGNNYRSYRNIQHTYEASFDLHDFSGTVATGKYQFPFTFVLPSSMTGSFTFSEECYIQYTCAARLTHSDYKQSQVFGVLLNILEPLRASIGPISVEDTIVSQCCAMWFDYGSTVTTLTCDKNYLVAGDKFTVKGVIDNSRGKQEVKQGQATLEERRIMIGHGGKQSVIVDASYGLYAINKSIEVGQKVTFSFQGSVPQEIKNSSAIGQITARYYVIHFKTEQGCCSNEAEAILHIMVLAKMPDLMKKRGICRPEEDWEAQHFPPTKFTSMPPYIYDPLPQIPSRYAPSKSDQMQYPQPQFMKQINPAFTLYNEPYWNTGQGRLKIGQVPTFMSEMTEMVITEQ